MTGTLSDLQMVCVVAMARNRVIGDGSDLIWHLPGDLKRVKELTMGCPLIMGRRTWDSIGRALPGRLSIVLTRNSDWSAPEALAVQTIKEAIEAGAKWLVQQGQGENRLILFGGGEIYAAGLDYCNLIRPLSMLPAGGCVFLSLRKAHGKISICGHRGRPKPSGFHYPSFGAKILFRPLVTRFYSYSITSFGVVRLPLTSWSRIFWAIS